MDFRSAAKSTVKKLVILRAMPSCGGVPKRRVGSKGQTPIGTAGNPASSRRANPALSLAHGLTKGQFVQVLGSVGHYRLALTCINLADAVVTRNTTTRAFPVRFARRAYAGILPDHLFKNFARAKRCSARSGYFATGERRRRVANIKSDNASLMRRPPDRSKSYIIQEIIELRTAGEITLITIVQ
jgi:hypothetical protein